MSIKKRKLKDQFVKELLKDNTKYSDTNAGFRKFLKRKGEAPFNFRRGGLATQPKLAKRGF